MEAAREAYGVETRNHGGEPDLKGPFLKRRVLVEEGLNVDRKDRKEEDREAEPVKEAIEADGERP